MDNLDSLRAQEIYARYNDVIRSWVNSPDSYKQGLANFLLEVAGLS